MANNLLLVINGVAPAVGVFGQMPRDLHDIENDSVDAAHDANDANDKAITVRMLATAATLQTVADR